MRLVAGLGNPGKEYRRSRHNLGFMVIDRLAQTHKAGNLWARLSRGASKVRIEIGPENVWLFKPQDYMNNSGPPVVSMFSRLGLSYEQLIVIHDDLDLEPGKLRVSFGGGAGGHKGVASIIQAAGTTDFFRVRLGIGKPAGGGDAVEYVLKPFAGEEWKAAEQMIERACEAVKMLVSEGLEKTQNAFNKRQ